MQSNELILEMRNINKSFSGVQVLFDAGIQLRAGEIHGLVGENGAGKTTLIKILCGMYPDYSGEIFLEGRSAAIHSPKNSRDSGIFSVQQHRDLVPTMTAAENIFLGNYIVKRNGSIDLAEMRRKAEEYFRIFEARIDLDVPVSDLKVSEQEIVAICKAIASDGKIFLIDEASAPLDNHERTILYNLLRKLRDEGKGIIYISHHLEEIFSIGDRVTVLRNGRNVWTKDISDTDREDLISAMTGNKKLYERTPHVVAGVDGAERVPVFELENVSFDFIEGASFSIFKGEVIGFAGLESSGKSEVASLMFGLTQPESGSMKYNGETTRFSRPSQAIRKDIAMIPTERKVQGLSPCRSVAENTVLAAVNKAKQIFVSRGKMTKTTQRCIRDLGIVTSSTNQLVEYLSGGNQQKTLIAKWMVTEMDILLCVEPTEGVDIGARADIYRIMREMSKNGTTIVVFSSDIDELLTLCDRIYTMYHGRITGEFDANSVEKSRILSEILAKGKAGDEAV